MNQSNILAKPSRQFKWAVDRWGIFASALCAIHCLITPIIFLALPKFGEVWAHPSSHWIMALIVIPLAFLTMRINRGQAKSRWSSLLGGIGIILIVLGALTPSLESHFGTSYGLSSPTPVEVVEKDSSESSCSDPCCPTVAVQEDGEVQWEIPLASIITTLGGLCLIITHITNIRCCLNCKSPTSV